MGDLRGRAAPTADNVSARTSARSWRSPSSSKQGNIYNSFNSSLQMLQRQNSTTNGVGLSVLWCPSDGEIVNLR